MRLITATVALCLAAAGCAKSDYIDGARISKINEDAVHQSPIAWNSAEIEDERHVLLFYESGVEPCYVLGQPDIDYGQQTVTITLNEGAASSEEALTCPSISIGKVVRIELSEPIAGREVVDGSNHSSS